MAAGVKLADVAKSAGVSQGTASNVFNRPELVRQEVREHVLSVARELGYAGPDLKGRLLRAGKVNAIGVAAVEPLGYFFDDPWARALLSAISDVCDANGTGLALVSAKNRQKLDWNIRNALVDGFILLCVEGGEKLVDLTRERQLPFIALALGAEDASIPAIGIDNLDGAGRAARYMADMGHRRIAVLGIEFSEDHVGRVSRDQVYKAAYSTTRDRAIGYWQALAAYGLSEDDVPVFEGRSDKASVDTCMEEMFSTDNPPTGILAMSDRVAILAMNWLSARGLSVPHDVSIIGFDGVPEAGMIEPGLTTMAQPFAEIARRAVDAILEDSVPAQRESVPLQLVIRGSVGAPKAE